MFMHIIIYTKGVHNNRFWFLSNRQTKYIFWQVPGGIPVSSLFLALFSNRHFFFSNLMWQQLFLYEIQRITTLLLWNTWNKKKSPNTFRENNHLPYATNVFNYTDFTKVAIYLVERNKKFGIHCIVLDCFSILLKS